MEANAGAYWADDIAFFRGAQRLGEDARQLLNPAPAHLAAFQRLLVSRVGDSQLAEVRTAARLLNHGVCLVLSFSNLLRSRVFRQRDQDVAEVQFGTGVVLIADLFCQSFNFLRQNGDATTNFIVTHFRNNHLFTNLITVGVVVNAVIGQAATHLIHGHVVLFCNVGDRLVELIVRDLHAHFLAHLQDNLVHD